MVMVRFMVNGYGLGYCEWLGLGLFLMIMVRGIVNG